MEGLERFRGLPRQAAHESVASKRQPVVRRAGLLLATGCCVSAGPFRACVARAATCADRYISLDLPWIVWAGARAGACLQSVPECRRFCSCHGWLGTATPRCADAIVFSARKKAGKPCTRGYSYRSLWAAASADGSGAWNAGSQGAADDEAGGDRRDGRGSGQ